MRKNNKFFGRAFWYLVLTVICILMVFPFFWLISSSLKLEKKPGPTCSPIIKTNSIKPKS